MCADHQDKVNYLLHIQVGHGSLVLQSANDAQQQLRYNS